MSLISQLGQATANHTIEKVALEIDLPDSWNPGAGALGAGAYALGDLGVHGRDILKTMGTGGVVPHLKANKGRIGKGALIAALLAGLVPSIVTNSKS